MLSTLKNNISNFPLFLTKDRVSSFSLLQTNRVLFWHKVTDRREAPGRSPGLSNVIHEWPLVGDRLKTARNPILEIAKLFLSYSALWEGIQFSTAQEN